MGQRESAPHARRHDSRWARVALEQLSDDEFLSKQLRRQETLAGARQAAASSGAARHQRTRTGLFVDSGRSVRDGARGGGRTLWTQLLKRRESDPTDLPGDDVAIEDASKVIAAQRIVAEQRRDDDLLQALVLLGNLSQPARAAYLLSHLQEQLVRQCHVSDPVAEVVALRRAIMREIYDALAIQHQHGRVAATAFQATVDSIQRVAKDAAPTTGCMDREIRPRAFTPADAEAAFAADMVVELLGGLLESPTNCEGETLPTRDVLYEMVALIETLTPLSLQSQPSRVVEPQSGGLIVRRLVQKLQRFLLAMATHPGVDVMDRTNAVNCLIRLAAANGSVRDFLIVVTVLLGVGDGAESGDALMNVADSPVSNASSPRAVRLAQAPTARLSHASPSRNPLYLKENDSTGDIGDDNERGDVSDEQANYAVEQRLKQVHKQRADQGVRDFDAQTTAVDQLLSSHTKRKAGGPKTLVVAHIKTTVATAAAASSLAIPPLAVHRSTAPTLATKSLKTTRDNLNNLSLEADLAYSLDATSSRSDIPSSPRSPRHERVIAPIVVCPTFYPLNVGEVLKAMDQIEPTPATTRRTSVPHSLYTSTDPITHHDADGSDDDHVVWSCGQNSYGELGHGDATTRTSFERIVSLQQKDIVDISAGNEHTVALSADGTVWTCGYNDNGQCGQGVTTRIPFLTEVSKLGDSRITQVHAYNGCEHTILVTHDGQAASCGYNYRGQLGHGNTQSESVPKILRSLDRKHVRLVSCSYYHTAITCDSGPTAQSRVFTFGRNDYGQLGHGDTMDRKVPQCIETIEDQHVASIACGQYHTMAVTASGKLLAFGKNDYGQLGVETVENQLAPVSVKHGLDRQTCVEVRCGYYHSMVLCAGGHVFACGRNDYGQLGLGKASHTLPVNTQLQQQRFAKPQLVEDLEGKEIVRIACGCYHTVAVSDNGVLYVFGRNNHGQLGTGDTNERLYPYPIDEFVGKRVALVAAGFYHTLVLTGGKDDEGGEDPDRSASLPQADADDEVDRLDGSGVTCTTILRSAFVQELYDTKRHRTDLAKTVPSLLARSRPHTQEPSSDGDADDGQTEDRARNSTVDLTGNKATDTMAANPRLVTQDHDDTEGTLGNLSHDVGDSIDVVVVILAQLDRLSSLFLMKKGTSFPMTQQLTPSVSEQLLRRRNDEELRDVVDGVFENFAIDVHGTTLSTLCGLIAQLSCRRFEALKTSSLSSRGAPAAGQLQAYLVGVSFRLLQANLVQAMQSGLGSLLIALQQTDGACPEPNLDLGGLVASVRQLRTLLLNIVAKAKPLLTTGGHTLPDVSSTESSCTGSRQGVSEAINTLMLGFDVFFPCPCSRVLLLETLMSSPSTGDLMACDVCRSLELTPLLECQSKCVLLSSLLKRLADDSTIIKLLPLDHINLSTTTPSNKPFQALDKIVDVLLEAMNSQFMHTLGDIAAAYVSREDESIAADQSLNGLMVILLNVIQKHLGALAISCERWTRHLDLDCAALFSTRLSAVAASTIRVGSVSADDPTGVDFPIVWRMFLQFALRIITQSCDLLAQVLSRSQPSPNSSAHRQQRRTHQNPAANAAFCARVADVLEQSVVGRVLRLLVNSLLAFSHLPAFAVSLIHPLQSVLKLLDAWNSTNQNVKRLADNDDHLGKSLTSSIVSVKQKAEGSTTIRVPLTSRVPVAEVLDAPWSLLLEKELAMLCAELAVTITTGEPLIHVSFDHEGTDSNERDMKTCHSKWQRSLLFEGGLSSDYIHASLVTGSTPTRTIPYSPNSLFSDSVTIAPTFLLAIPQREEIEQVDDIQSDCETHAHLETRTMRLLRRSHVRAFISEMAQSTQDPLHDGQRSTAHVLCEWLRSCHAKTDPAYRMLLRQAQLQKQAPPQPGSLHPSSTSGHHVWSDPQLEETFFAALLHQHSVESFALLVGVGRQTNQDETAHDRVPPLSLRGLWKVVADCRRRFVAKRSAIKNALSSEEAPHVILTLQRAIRDRSHLLLLVEVDEEEEHRLCLLDGGCVAPYDPAILFRACQTTEASPVGLTSFCSHMSARYGETMLPFLIAYPTSRWRRVRLFFHIVARWRAVVVAASSIGSAKRTAAALEFVTADEAEVGDLHKLALTLLLEPCRQLSCAARGYELLWELMTMPLLSCVRVSLLQQVCHASAQLTQEPFGLVLKRNAPYAYREMHRTAQKDFVTAVVQLLVDQASATAVTSDSAAPWVLLVLLRCLSLVHFASDQYAFMNDVGLVQVLEQMLWNGDAEGSEDKADSIGGGISTREDIATPSGEPQIQAVVWTLLRSISLHLSVSSSNNAHGSIPVYPACFDIYQSLFNSARRLLQRLSHQSTSQRSVLERRSTNSTIRRSFELIVAPKRFTFLNKGLAFTYQQMLEPTPGVLAMSPLVKPSEFSITLWIYAAVDQGDAPDEHGSFGISEEKQVVFVRGDARELSPYLLLVRDLENNWQLEVGVAVHVAHPNALTPTATRLLWERLISKESLWRGRWTHVAIVLEGAKLRLYLNGVLDSQRSLSGPLAMAIHSGSVDLDFSFGRPQPVVSSDDGDAETNISKQEPHRDAEAMAFLSAIVSANTTTSGSVPSPSNSLVRTFHGLLSHVRFHNRALSPIHVRIVYDEKKPVKDDAHSASNLDSRVSDEATKLLQLHALLRVMVESDEGRVHLADSSWVIQLWEIFMDSRQVTLQLSSVRLLRLVLRFQTPQTVADEIAHRIPAPLSAYRFVDHLLQIIGVCVSPVRVKSDAPFSVPATLQTHPHRPETHEEEAVELRNSTAVKLLKESTHGSISIALANELTELLTDLLQEKNNAAWAPAIWKTFSRVLDESEGYADDQSAWCARLGCLYVLGGSAKGLTSGSPVELTGAKESATVIAMDDAALATKANGGDGVHPNRFNPTVYVSIREEYSPEHASKDGRSWYDHVLEECANYKKQIAASQQSAQNKHGGSNGTDAVPFVRLHPDDVVAASPISPITLARDTLSSGTLRLLSHAALSLTLDVSAVDTRGVAELKRWLSSSLLVHAVMRMASDTTSVSPVIHERGLFQKLLEMSCCNDGNPHFATFEDVERKLWIVRTRVYDVLHDLEDQGEVEVNQWFQATQTIASVETVVSHRTKNEVYEKPGEDEDDGESIPPPSAKLDLRLDLAVEDPASHHDNSSQRSSSSSHASLVGDLIDPSKREAPDSTLDEDEEVDGKYGEEDEDEEEEEEEEEEGDEDEDDEDAAEHRQEFVDELMMMGFPEEWCVLALKQTENDIVSASAWIVDNLEYLSRLQTSLDQQRDQGTDQRAYDDEDDDDDDEEEESKADIAESEELLPMTAIDPAARQGTGNRPHPHSPVRSDGPQQQLINEKEMGRKVFGEMYFPFDDGGYASNAKEQFFTPWRSETKKATPPVTTTDTSEEAQAPPESKDPSTIEQFAAAVNSLELCELLDRLAELERAFLVLSCRQVVASLLHYHDQHSQIVDEEILSSPSFLTFVKLVLCRGPQFELRFGREEEAKSVDATVCACMTRMLREQKNAVFSQRMLDYALQQVEAAASSAACEAVLWTHRELRRPDCVVLDEPAVELAAWMVDIVLGNGPDSIELDSQQAVALLQRLRPMLRAANLPVKYIVITTMSRVLRRVRRLQQSAVDSDSRLDVRILATSGMDVESFLCAAQNRFLREHIQHRLVFSLYLQAYVEILCLLQQLTAVDCLTRTLPPPIPTSCLPAPPSDPSQAIVNHPTLAFDRLKSRSSLLQISDDGLTAAYTGNDMWKTVVATQSFATGVHAWHIRIDKSASSYLFVGVATHRVNVDAFLGSDDQSWGFIGDKALYYQRNRLRIYGDSFGEGDVVGVHLDCEHGTLGFSKNGVELGVAFENLLDEVFPAVAFYSRHQKVSIVRPTDSSERARSYSSVPSDGTVEEAVAVCAMMDAMVTKIPLPQHLIRPAYEMTLAWWHNTGRHIVTRTGAPLWVDTTAEACGRFGFQADEPVRSPRGNGRVVGVADERLWIEVDAEAGAWHIHPSRLRTMTLSVSATGSEKSESVELIPPAETARASYEPMPTQEPHVGALTQAEFTTFIHDCLWSIHLDRVVLRILNTHAESASLSPWNLQPSEIVRLLRSKAHEIEVATGVAFPVDDSDAGRRLERKLLARVGLLRFFNASLSRVVRFFDCTWQYFASSSSSACSGSSLGPSRLVSQCRGSVFTSIKNDFFSSLLDKTSTAPTTKSDDDYDYPEELPQILLNRPKAATAKCHRGTTTSLLQSLFGQAFDALHFLPPRLQRMVYSHPMDDGQRRSFKVKFEGEGVDDYGGPYREFFSQVFAELQLVGEEADDDHHQGFLPFLLPSPNWRHGVGTSRERFILNGGLLGSSHVGSARVLPTTTLDTKKTGWAESNQVKRQLHTEMVHFLGHLLGVALRTRVCVRLDLAASVWKQLVGDNADDHNDRDLVTVLADLEETDFAAHALLTTLSTLYHGYTNPKTDRTQRQALADQVVAMDLSFTTFLSDGRLVELCPNGSETSVTVTNVSTFITLVLQARRDEAKEVVNVLKQGLHAVLPVAALSLLTWDELELRLCGVATVDIMLLQRNTEYDDDVAATDDSVLRFWRVLEAMNDDDRRAFLRFVWARARLPVGQNQFHQKFKIQSLAPVENSSISPNGFADNQLPKAHTCFFALQLPRYSTDAICRQQVLYAIHNCVEMDGDFRLADAEMTGWTDVDPNDQLRF